MVSQAEHIAQGHQVAEAVARTDEREGDVLSSEIIDHDVGRTHDDVHAVLGSHDADIGGEMPAAPAKLRAIGTALQPESPPPALPAHLVYAAAPDSSGTFQASIYNVRLEGTS
jgi:hypothetical protein